MPLIDERSPSRADLEHALRECLARMRKSTLDFTLRVEAGELLVALGDRPRGVRVLRSCADYFTLAGFPLRALWALKLLEQHQADRAVVDRGLSLLARHYSKRDDVEWGDRIFEMPMQMRGDIDITGLPATLDEVVAEVDRRATDIIRGAEFPDQLPRLPLLSELEADAFLTVARSSRLRRVVDGAVLIDEGEPGHAAYMVVTGTVRVIKRTDDGGAAQGPRLSEGDVFGEMALITQSPRIASVVAEGPVNVLELPASMLDDLGAESSALRSALSRHVCDRMVSNLVNMSPVFQVLPTDRRGELISRFQSRLIERDEEIIVEGDEGKGLYIILDGQVQVSRRKDGQVHVLSYLRESDIFGEISLIRETPATATCTATRRTMVMFLSRDAFTELTRDYPEVVSKINELGEARVLDSLFTLA